MEGWDLQRPTKQRQGDKITLNCSKVSFLSLPRHYGTPIEVYHYCSAVQNILLRLAWKHNLNLVLPSKTNHLNNPKLPYHFGAPFTERWLDAVPWHKDLKERGLYHMTLLHSLWNHREFSKLLGPTTKYVTILRDPSEAFQSLYNYANLGDAFDMSFSEYVAK